MHKIEQRHDSLIWDRNVTSDITPFCTAKNRWKRNAMKCNTSSQNECQLEDRSRKVLCIWCTPTTAKELDCWKFIMTCVMLSIGLWWYVRVLGNPGVVYVNRDRAGVPEVFFLHYHSILWRDGRKTYSMILRGYEPVHCGLTVNRHLPLPQKRNTKYTIPSFIFLHHLFRAFSISRQQERAKRL